MLHTILENTNKKTHLEGAITYKGSDRYLCGRVSRGGGRVRVRQTKNVTLNVNTCKSCLYKAMKHIPS